MNFRHKATTVSKKNRAQQSLQFREQLLMYVLHDIRSPYKYIERLSEYLSTHHQQMPPEKLTAYLNDLNESAHQFSTFTESYLAWITAQTDEFDIQNAPVNLKESVQKILDIYRSIAIFKNIELINNIPENAIFKTDEMLLNIIIRNLVDNAIKHTQSCILTIDHNQNVNPTIVIKDSGKGMPKEQLENLKYSLTAKRKEVTKGIGLLIVNELCERLNTTIHIESAVDNGTTIQLIFPTNTQIIL